MKRFLISYRYGLAPGTDEQEWHRRIAEFIAQLREDPELKGRINYRCMKAKAGNAYYHLAETADEAAGDLLGQRDFFKRYTAEIRRVGGGEVVVTPLDTIAET